MRLFARLLRNRLSHPNSRAWIRSLRVESLENRQLLIAEGSPFTLPNQNFDTSGLGGTISGTVDWGNGKSSAANVGVSPTAGPLRIRFDYSLDTAGFFTADRKDTLQRTADALISKFSDTLLPITPGGSNTWIAKFRHPGTGANQSLNNLNIGANEILVFAGARPLPAGVRGLGNRGGFSASSPSQAFLDTVKGRGQVGALASPPTDFSLWGGSISFDTATTWHFGVTTQGLDPNEFDFATVASHELIHVLGFGTSDTFNARVSGNSFTGPNAIAAAGVSPVPMSDPDHFADSLISNGSKPIMTASLSSGQRKLPTRLDLAALQDVGWVLINPKVQASGSHTFGDDGNYGGSITLRGSIYGEISYPVGTANVTNVAPSLTSTGTLNTVAGVASVFSNLGQFTDPGFGESQISPPRTESFTYTIDWGDGTAPDIGMARIDSLGAAGRLTMGSFDGTHTFAKPGTYTLLLTVRDDDGGQATQSRTIVVGAPPSLSLTVDKTSFPENAGANAASLTVRRQGFDISRPLVVSLASSDTSELTVPATATIEAGNESVVIPIAAVDDDLLDGTITATVQASFGSISSDRLVLNVIDFETISLSANRTIFGENEGAGVSILTVSRSNSDTSSALTVTLASSDTTEVVVPVRVEIPAGFQSTTVGLTAVDDNLFDGSQSVIITASESRYQNGTLNLTVTDHQPISLVLQLSELVEESQNSTMARVSIRSPAPSGGVSISLVSSLPNQLRVPTSVVIPQGQTGIDFQVQLIDDFIVQGRRNARIAATGNGVIAGTIDVVLSDDDFPYWTNPRNRHDVDNNKFVDPLDVLLLINLLVETGTRVLNPNNESDRRLPFVDVNLDGSFDPLDVLTVINAINGT